MIFVHLHVYTTDSNCNNWDLELSEIKTDAAHFRRLAFQGAERRYGIPLSSLHKERIEYELKVICQKRCQDYILFVQDLVAAMKEKGVVVGPGRSSLAGSAVLYCLGITNVDPIKNNLLFERFFNPDKMTMPQIDLDLESPKEAMAYLRDKYGTEHVASVGMLGIHAEGVHSNLIELPALSVIHDCLRMISERHGQAICVDDIPVDDNATYRLYERGDTFGVFAFDSDDIKSWLVRLHPSHIDDLSAIYALCRPGPNDHLPLYCARKNGNEAVTYELPEMEEYLSDTYGVAIYQEQIMLLSRKLAGFTNVEADLLRRALSNNKFLIMEELKTQFINRGCAKGYPGKKLRLIWDDWKERGPYLFNKSHAACHALVSYQTAWLKCHYRLEYDAALRKNAGYCDNI